MTFTFDLTRLAFFWPWQIFSNALWRQHFHFHIVSINPCFIASYNSFQKVFILASTIQKSLTDGNTTVSLILWQKSRANFQITWCISNFVVRMSWHDPIDILHSSAISCTVKRWLECTNLRDMGIVTWLWEPSRVDCRTSLNCLNHS
jgi:hypothetical protein